MPMECHRTEPELATSGTSWTMDAWPFMPEQVRQQEEADKDKPKATDRLYGADGRLVVAPGMVLPDDVSGLLTEDQVLGRAPAEPPATQPETVVESRRQVRRK